MVFSFATSSRLLFAGWLVLLISSVADVAQGQGTNPLPDYVTEQYGVPPTVPDGPLSPAMQFALRVAFVDSVVLSTWDENQTLALAEIAQSEDPRLVWLISDLMRFVPSQQLNAALTNAASELLGKQLALENSWGVVTDHLIDRKSVV